MRVLVVVEEEEEQQQQQVPLPPPRAGLAMAAVGLMRPSLHTHCAALGLAVAAAKLLQTSTISTHYDCLGLRWLVVFVLRSLVFRSS